MERSTLSGFLSIFSTKVVVLLVGLFSTPLLVRLLTKSQYGDYAFVLSVFGLYMILVSGSIGDGVRKYLAENREVERWHEDVLGFYFLSALGLAVLGALGLIVAASFAGEGLLGPSFRTYFYVLAALVVAAQFRTFVRRALMGFGLERISEPLKVLNKVLVVGVGLGLVWLGLGVVGMLVGYVVASTAVFLVGLVFLGRRIPLRSLVTVPSAAVPRRQFLTYSSLSLVLVLLLNSLYHVDVLMLRPWTGSVETSNYKAALAMAEFLWFVPLAVQGVLVQSTSHLWSNDRHEQISELSARVTRYTLLLTSLLAIGLAALAPIVVPLYLSAKYAPAVTPLRLLLPGVLGFAVARPLIAFGQGKGDLSVLVGATGVAAVINLVLNVLLIPRFGMNGAAVATSVGYGSMLVVHVAAGRRLGYDPSHDLRPVRVAATVLLGALVIFALAARLGEGLPALVIVPPAGFVAFAGFAFLTGALDAAECRSMADRFPSPVGPWLARRFEAVGG